MHVQGDFYRVFWTEGVGTSAGGVWDNWQAAKAERNNIFFQNLAVRAAWVMKDNPSLNTVPGLYGSTLRRTKHEAMA